MAIVTSRGLGVAPGDLDASRLVFVSVEGARPKRKVAVPIPEGGTWAGFCATASSKLRIAGVASATLVATGERVTSLEVLQDIDEISVVPTKAEAAPSLPAPAAAHPPSLTTVAHAAPSASAVRTTSFASSSAGVRHADAGPRSGPTEGTSLDAEAWETGDDKYAKRQSALGRAFRGLLPSRFLGGSGGGPGGGGGPGLPLTARDAAGGGAVDGPTARGGRASGRGPQLRRRRRSWRDPKALVAALALLTFAAALWHVYGQLRAVRGE